MINRVTYKNANQRFASLIVQILKRAVMEVDGLLARIRAYVSNLWQAYSFCHTSVEFSGWQQAGIAPFDLCFALFTDFWHPASARISYEKFGISTSYQQAAFLPLRAQSLCSPTHQKDLVYNNDLRAEQRQKGPRKAHRILFPPGQFQGRSSAMCMNTGPLPGLSTIRC